MKPDIAIQDLLFGVDQVPVEAVTGTDTLIELRHAYYLLHDPPNALLAEEKASPSIDAWQRSGESHQGNGRCE